jgi:hypothetical protein
VTRRSELKRIARDWKRVDEAREAHGCLARYRHRPGMAVRASCAVVLTNGRIGGGRLERARAQNLAASRLARPRHAAVSTRVLVKPRSITPDNPLVLTME